jgi:uncharacterized membrane protein
MTYLIIGLIVFLGVHSIRIFSEDARTRLRTQWGENAYKGVYSVISLLGFGMLVWGFGVARETPVVLWTPPIGMRHLASLLTLLAFVLLECHQSPGPPPDGAVGQNVGFGALVGYGNCRASTLVRKLSDMGGAIFYRRTQA